MEESKKFLTSKPAILGLFVVICLMLAIPLLILVSQEKQDNRQFASESTASAVKGIRTGTVSGYVYIDINGNGIRDPEEKPYSQAQLLLSDKNKTTSLRASSDSYGHFIFKQATLSESSTITLVIPSKYKVSPANPLPLANVEKQIVEIGVSAPVETVTPVPTCIMRPSCLNSTPRCLIAEPKGGWCPKVSVVPTKPVKISPVLEVKPSPAHK